MLSAVQEVELSKRLDCAKAMDARHRCGLTVGVHG